MGFGNIDLGAIRLKKAAAAAPTPSASSPASASPASASPVLQRTTSLSGLKAGPASGGGGSPLSRRSPSSASSAAIDNLLKWVDSIVTKYEGVSGACLVPSLLFLFRRVCGRRLPCVLL